MENTLFATLAPLRLVPLHTDGALDAAVVGAKAAAIARADRRGLPAVDGFVIPVESCERIAAGIDSAMQDRLFSAWAEATEDGVRTLIVRSSSPVEDGESSSMAGMFLSVPDVDTFPEFVTAVQDVIRSAAPWDAPMAVLVQRQLTLALGGVGFGVDPIAQRAGRIVVAVAAGGAHHIVGGEVAGTTYRLSLRGRSLSYEPGTGGARLTRRQRHDLARLTRAAAHAFGCPQDIEWGIDLDGVLHLLQSRPVTTAYLDRRNARGPIYGAGPIAETFPEPLSPLEADLWVPALREGLRDALRLAGAGSQAVLERNPALLVVGGQPVVDLDLLGVLPLKGGFFARFDPRPPARRLRMAWRVGRLKLAEPEIASSVVRHLDVLLAEVPALTDLDAAQLLGVWARSGEALRCAHAHEVLCGLLLDEDAAHNATGAGVALRMLADGRRLGLDDVAIVARSPEVHALTAPRIGPATPLPHLADLDVGWRGGHDGLSPREQLRLRVRWLHELTALVAMELGRRLVARGVLEHAEEIRSFGLVELDRLSRVGARRPEPVVPPERRSLPAAFRLTGDGRPVAVAQAGTGSGVGASGGTFSGVVTHDPAESVGRVLVVRWLDPGLAAVLSGLGAIVAETGSPLSHLAILAREQGVPCVVASSEAVERFLPGQTVTVDGRTGSVELVELEMAVA